MIVLQAMKNSQIFLYLKEDIDFSKEGILGYNFYVAQLICIWSDLVGHQGLRNLTVIFHSGILPVKTDFNYNSLWKSEGNFHRLYNFVLMAKHQKDQKLSTYNFEK